MRGTSVGLFFWPYEGQESENGMESRTEVEVLEAKYCEGCGALCMRPRGSKVTYCKSCSRRMAELPSSTREPGGRP